MSVFALRRRSEFPASHFTWSDRRRWLARRTEGRGTEGAVRKEREAVVRYLLGLGDYEAKCYAGAIENEDHLK